MKSYSYLLPKLYAQKTKFLNQQNLKEICEAEAPEKIAQILRDHGYFIEGSPRDFTDLVNSFEIAAQKRIDRIISFSPKEAEKILRAVDSWEKVSSIILAAKIFESTGDARRAMAALPWSEDDRLRQMIEQGSIVLGSSAPQLRAVLQFYFEGDIREIVINSLKVFEEGGGISAYQLNFLLMLGNYLLKKVSKLSSIRKREIMSVLCEYLDTSFVIVSINAMRNESSKIVSTLLEKSRMCKISGREIIEAIQTGTVQQLYAKLISSMGGSLVKGEDPELQTLRFLRKRIKRIAEVRFGSFPFTPALPLAAVLLINAEKTEIMKLFIEMRSGINCEEAVQKSSL